jgi:hypothetical protein
MGFVLLHGVANILITGDVVAFKDGIRFMP